MIFKVHALHQPPTTTGPGYHHANRVARLSRTKVVFQKNLDKRINIAFTHCSDDKKSKICRILWDDVEECLQEIDTINQEIRFHTWNLLMDVDS